MKRYVKVERLKSNMDNPSRRKMRGTSETIGGKVQDKDTEPEKIIIDVT